MVQHLVSAVALAGVAHQQVADQVLGGLAHRLPLVLGEVVHAVLDGGEQQLLAILAGLAALPAAVLPTLAVEGRVATQHDVPDEKSRKIFNVCS